MRKFSAKQIREWERNGQKLDFGEMLELADYLEAQSAENSCMRALLEIGTGCEYPKDCLHFPETSPTQRCCGWCAKRYTILYETDSGRQ